MVSGWSTLHLIMNAVYSQRVSSPVPRFPVTCFSNKLSKGNGRHSFQVEREWRERVKRLFLNTGYKIEIRKCRSEGESKILLCTELRDAV